MKQIDIEQWTRKEIYEMFSKVDYPFYSITLPVDVTYIKQASKAYGVSFYYLMVWACTKAVNQVPALNMRIKDHQVYQLERTEPSFTVMRKGEEHFRIITMPWERDFNAFCKHAETLNMQQETLFGAHEYKDALIYFSCLPWFDFTALTNERNFDKDDTIPRIAWGKYNEVDGRLIVHLSIDVNHRTVDGFHIAQFKEALDHEINKFNSNEPTMPQ